MKVKWLDIENFRGIRKMRIDFHPQLNVFAGKNGAGKTTVLNALGRAIETAYLNHITGNERQALESRVIINPGYIRVGEKNACIKIAIFTPGQRDRHDCEQSSGRYDL